MLHREIKVFYASYRIPNALHECSMVWRVQNEPNELKKCTEIQAETRNIKTKQLF